MGDQAIDVDRRIFGEGHHFRPPLFQPYQCRNILIEGVTFRESPYWNVHPTFCTSVTVRGIRIQPGIMNDDGVDPGSSRDVLIEDCVFETTDDNVAIKSGRDRDGRSGPPCENIVIRRCRGVRAQTNAFAIGSEISGSKRTTKA